MPRSQRKTYARDASREERAGLRNQVALAPGESARGLGVDVRSGLHTGEVELINEGIGGIAPHIGARISALAEPGQVLVSRTIVDLVAGSGIDFDDCGEHELKGSSRRIAAVLGPKTE